MTINDSTAATAEDFLDADSALDELAPATCPVLSSNEQAAGAPGWASNRIAPDALDALLPDEGVILLPEMSRVNGGYGYRFLKRLFDVVGSLCALAVLAIPMAVVAAAIKAESPGPAIYSQTRVGKGGNRFEIYKFRSMYADAEARGAQWAADGDSRVTPIGKKIRHYRIDELPQFWNVVRGDMSLIGPRPERPVFHDVFCERIQGWEQRLAVRPGITGLAQVEGGYGLLPKEKALYDINYIERRSLGLDLIIIWRTLKTMATGSGAR